MKQSVDLARAQPGDTVGPFQRRTGLEEWNRFAAVNEEFVPVHMDDAAGREAGFTGAIGMGNLQVAYVHNLLRDVVGTDGRVAAMECSFRSANLQGQQLSVWGRVASVTEGLAGRRIELEIWVEDEAGSRLSHGRATVVADARAADRPAPVLGRG
jgi:acyl dehydratase